MYPEYLPRVRVEWLVAGTRVVLAGGALVAVAIDPLEHARYSFLLYLLAWYLAYALGMLALVWAPIRFARGWDVAVHLFDFAVFSLLIVVTEAATSPFFMYFIFLLVCATLRWQLRGTIWTAAATMATHAGISFYVAELHRADFALNTFVIRNVYLTVLSVLVGYLGAHQHRFQSEIGRIAAWPRRISRDPQEVVAEVISQGNVVLGKPNIVLAWEEPGEAAINLAWRSDGQVKWVQESDPAYRPLVLPVLDGKSFQVADAAQDRSRVLSLTARGFRHRDCRPINETLRARFDMHVVQSWPLDGELLRGRMFCFGKTRMRLDDLILGELVAQLAVSRLESLHILGRLRDAAALEERVRLARDLHDSLLQSQAGAALQLLAARRLLDRQPDAARRRLEEVQHHLERGEIEMRSFIRDLRPAKAQVPEAATKDLTASLEDLSRRVERQWEITVNLRLNGTVDQVPAALRNDVYRLAQEAIINAARHANASAVSVALSVNHDELRLEIVDDGRGFPFHGTYDLSGLTRMNRGPLTLKERVAQLAGDLTLKSTDSGTALLMRLPLAHTSG